MVRVEFNLKAIKINLIQHIISLFNTIVLHSPLRCSSHGFLLFSLNLLPPPPSSHLPSIFLSLSGAGSAGGRRRSTQLPRCPGNNHRWRTRPEPGNSGKPAGSMSAAAAGVRERAAEKGLLCDTETEKENHRREDGCGEDMEGEGRVPL